MSGQLITLQLSNIEVPRYFGLTVDELNEYLFAKRGPEEMEDLLRSKWLILNEQRQGNLISFMDTWITRRQVEYALQNYVLLSKPKIAPIPTRSMEFKVDISSVFEEKSVGLIQKGARASDLMSDNERKLYEETQETFDSLAKDLLKRLLEKRNATEGLKRMLMEWLLLLVVRIDAEIEKQ